MRYASPPREFFFLSYFLFCKCFHFAMFLQLPTAQVSHFCCGRDYARPFKIAKSEACMRALRKHAIQLLPAQSWSRRDSTVAASEARRLLITCQCGSRTYRERVTHTNTHTHTHKCAYMGVYTDSSKSHIYGTTIHKCRNNFSQ